MEKVYTLTPSSPPLRVIEDGLKNGKTSNTQFRVIIIIIITVFFLFYFFVFAYRVYIYIYTAPPLLLLHKGGGNR